MVGDQGARQQPNPTLDVLFRQPLESTWDGNSVLSCVHRARIHVSCQHLPQCTVKQPPSIPNAKDLNKHFCETKLRD